MVFFSNYTLLLWNSFKEQISETKDDIDEIKLTYLNILGSNLKRLNNLNVKNRFYGPEWKMFLRIWIIDST